MGVCKLAAAQDAMGAARARQGSAGRNRALAVVNGCVATPDGLVEPCDVLIGGDRIAAVGPPGRIQAPAAAETLDATGQVVLPGFIDLCGPALARSAQDDRAAQALADELARAGTTRFISAITLESATALRELRRVIADHEHRLTGARLAGLRLEVRLVGGGDGRMSAAEAKRVLSQARDLAPDWPILVIVTVRTPGASELARWASGRGMVVGMKVAHAGYDESRQAIQAGVRHVVDTLEALDDLHQREPGGMGAALLDDSVTVELQLADDAVSPTAVGFVVRAKGAERCVLVGTPVGRDGGGMLAAVARAAEVPGVGVVRASAMASGQPAAVCGLEKAVGRIAEGMTADLAVVTRGFEVTATIVAGAVAYRRDAA